MHEIEERNNELGDKQRIKEYIELFLARYSSEAAVQKNYSYNVPAIKTKAELVVLLNRKRSR